MNPAKKSFLLLVIGLEMLSWFFPIHYASAILGFITVWATLGMRWAVAVTLFSDIPDIIQQAYAVIFGFMLPLLPKIQLTIQDCGHILNRTLANQCSQRYLNLTSALPKGSMQMIQNLPRPPSYQLPAWISMALKNPNILFIFFPLWLTVTYFGVIRPILKLRNAIRRAISNRYGFRGYK